MNNSFAEKSMIKIGNVLIRFYNEILAGTFGLLILIPLDYLIRKNVDGYSEYTMSPKYFVYAIFYIIFFIASSALVPYVKRLRIKQEIEKMNHNRVLTRLQLIKISKVIQDVITCKSIFTIEGFLQFAMLNLFSFGTMMLYFSIEALIIGFMDVGYTKLSMYKVPGLYGMMFMLVLYLESIIDNYLAKKIRRERNAYGFYDKNKELLMTILMNVGGGGTLSQKLGQMLLEDTIEDISEILKIAESKERTGKKHFERNKKPLKKQAMTRGKIESKKGKFSSPKKSRKKLLAKNIKLKKSTKI